jgi:hypothetical protein
MRFVPKTCTMLASCPSTSRAATGSMPWNLPELVASMHYMSDDAQTRRSVEPLFLGWASR